MEIIKMHPAVEAGLDHWRDVNKMPNKWARFESNLWPGRDEPEVLVHIGPRNFRGEKEAQLLTRKFFIHNDKVEYVELIQS